MIFFFPLTPQKVFLAHLARTNFIYPTAVQFESVASVPYLNQGLSSKQIAALVLDTIVHGVYLETGASAVCCVFLGVGGGFLVSPLFSFFLGFHLAFDGLLHWC